MRARGPSSSGKGTLFLLVDSKLVVIAPKPGDTPKSLVHGSVDVRTVQTCREFL